MSSNEGWQRFEEAFAKIEPKDDADRERLARKKERMRVLIQGQPDIVARHKEEMATRKAESEETKRLVREGGAIASEIRDELFRGFDEQSVLIEHIAFHG